MNIRIGNRAIGDRGEYVGRPTPLGNPFRIGPHGDREQVMARYRHWLWQQMLWRTPAYTELSRLAGIARDGELVLVCWCHPLPCHADVLRAAILWLLQQPQPEEPADQSEDAAEDGDDWWPDSDSEPLRLDRLESGEPGRPTLRATGPGDER